MQASAKVGSPSEYVLFKPVKVHSTTGTGKNKKTTTTTVWVRAAGPVEQLHRDPVTGNAGLLDPYAGKIPKGFKVLPVPRRTTVITCTSLSAAVCPGDPGGVPPAGLTDYYLFKHGLYPLDRYGPYPNMTGKDLSLSGTRADFDPTSGAPIVLMQFTGKGNKAFHRVTKNEAVRGSIQNVAAALRDRARQRDPLVPVDRLQAVSGRHRPDRRRRADHRHGERQRGEEPRPRPADRRAARSSSCRSRTPRSRRHSARTR